LQRVSAANPLATAHLSADFEAAIVSLGGRKLLPHGHIADFEVCFYCFSVP
jgi:hypothetical protein